MVEGRLPFDKNSRQEIPSTSGHVHHGMCSLGNQITKLIQLWIFLTLLSGFLVGDILYTTPWNVMKTDTLTLTFYGMPRAISFYEYDISYLGLLRTSGLHVEFNLDVPGVELGGIVTRTLRG